MSDLRKQAGNKLHEWRQELRMLGNVIGSNSTTEHEKQRAEKEIPKVVRNIRRLEKSLGL